ncbi:vacuolar protein-sorting-associated protein 25 [Podospora conica]|nr:vacuolar protein-sorting-associated protein 25 [Schizothecium conicum]
MSTPPFPFPREYSFPPFFTRQTNLTTHHAQLTKWASLVLAYCRHHRLFKLSLSAAVSDPLSTTTSETKEKDTSDLFHNRKLNRRLSLADAREVVDFLRRDGRAEYVDGSTSGGGGGDVVWVYWRTPEEWAGLVEAWVDETAQKGSVLTLYELTEGDATRGAEFHGMDKDLLQKALGVLVKRGKAQIFGQEDSLGVKFF